MRKIRRFIRIFLKNRSGRVTSDAALIFSLGTLGSLIALAMVDVMPEDAVEFAIESLGGAIGLLE